MKKVILIMLMMLSISAFAQDFKREGNTFTPNKEQSVGEIKTDYLYTWTDNNTYPIYVGSKGGVYIKVWDKETSSYKKKYVEKSIADQVRKELNIKKQTRKQ